MPGGKITVLLGPNGAGKTTAIRMITGAFAPDAGRVRVFGLDPEVDGDDVRARCGVVSAKPALYDRLSGLDNLRYSAELYGLGRGAAGRRPHPTRRPPASASTRRSDDQVGGYSTGMKTRLALSRSVLHRPELLLYDEPTSGLDPESSHAVLEMIHEMTDDGSTVVMCTHLLLEAEGLADQVVVLQDGVDVINGSPDELTRRYWPDAMVRLGADDVDRPRRARRPRGRGRATSAPTTSPSCGWTPPTGSPTSCTRSSRAGARVTRVEPHEPTLEDLYFAVRQISGRSRLGAVDGSTV